MKRCLKYWMALIFQQLINWMSSSCEGTLNPWKSSGIIRPHPFCCCTFQISMDILNVSHQRKVYPCQKKKCLWNKHSCITVRQLLITIMSNANMIYDCKQFLGILMLKKKKKNRYPTSKIKWYQSSQIKIGCLVNYSYSNHKHALIVHFFFDTGIIY